MYFINFRNKFDIHRGKIILFVLLVSGFISTSQIDKRYNLPDYDNQPIHFGYLLGLNYSSFKVIPSEQFLKQDTIQSITARGKTGFEVGFIFNLRISEYFDIRALPKVAFYERDILYTFKTPAKPIVADFKSSLIEVPLLLKYKSHRRDNTRLYMVGGIKPSFEVGAKKRQNRSNQLGTKVFNMTLEYGIGIDNYYQMFKFAPELRFSLGVTEMLKKEKNMLSNSLQSVKPFNISIAIMFE